MEREQIIDLEPICIEELIKEIEESKVLFRNDGSTFKDTLEKSMLANFDSFKKKLMQQCHGSRNTLVKLV